MLVLMLQRILGTTYSQPVYLQQQLQVQQLGATCIRYPLPIRREMPTILLGYPQ